MAVAYQPKCKHDRPTKNKMERPTVSSRLSFHRTGPTVLDLFVFMMMMMRRRRRNVRISNDVSTPQWPNDRCIST
jgi:hypothetical protein